VFVALALLFAGAQVSAQAGDTEARLRAERAELDRLRRERDAAQERLRQLERSSRDMSAQARNLEEQANLTARTVNLYNRRLRSMGEDVDSASTALARAQDELLIKRATMRRRLVDIYKRGPLYSFEALLSAKSFGELLTRYKYLRTIAQEDRARVKRMETLRQKVSDQHSLLSVLTNELAVSRDEQAEEERRLRLLEDQWQRRAATTSQSAAALQRQIQRYIADEQRIASLIAEADAERARDPRAAAAVASKPVPAAERGRLDWPVDGDILYPYGRLVNPNNTVTRWNGIGIAAPMGTPVVAVADGVVVAAQHMSTYGMCVMLLHGDDYSLYCSLSRFSVTKGQTVQKGQKVGEVGVNDPEIGSHLHFEIRVKPSNSRVPMSIDPLDWLRSRR
jgi:septal ring factor EnvC (AmiA/AmiB activator)